MPSRWREFLPTCAEERRPLTSGAGPTQPRVPSRREPPGTDAVAAAGTASHAGAAAPRTCPGKLITK